MIQNFKHKGLQALYNKNDRRYLPPNMVERIRQILTLLDTVQDVDCMDMPAFRLHRLRGDLSGQWSVTVRANQRITFRFKDGDAFDVDFLDYH